MKSHLKRSTNNIFWQFKERLEQQFVFRDWRRSESPLWLFRLLIYSGKSILFTLVWRICSVLDFVYSHSLFCLHQTDSGYWLNLNTTPLILASSFLPSLFYSFSLGVNPYPMICIWSSVPFKDWLLCSLSLLLWGRVWSIFHALVISLAADCALASVI